jgi:hypothetical protein
MAGKGSPKGSSGKGGGQYHDAKTGKFVTPAYAKRTLARRSKSPHARSRGTTVRSPL